ncbi:hypothetical protein PPL_06657 [Heterostelium album PN500]|uniref:C2 domain-containing protein n=1 Tax=Heterostelium pallidum (strain ATCC 26659 / Pp 5 / PN500) TaxID=670386 RepID=D3BFC4_HETP5|nr:hypothetical protein PPL_06657 [Heterostelium album PN500]EFA79838.1 hypothetical protein PPL_06657 [Heterostelium album PN500]|eukprot:XP_020431959.1 hypothetical protein PPL_06657 [Heterostelium album PN500]
MNLAIESTLIIYYFISLHFSSVQLSSVSKCKPKVEWSSTLLEHPAQLFFSLKSLKGLKTNEESIKIYCLASLEKQTIQTTTLTINKNTDHIEWNEGYTFDVISPSSELLLSIWQTSVNNNSNSNNNSNNGNENDNTDDPMSIDRNSLPRSNFIFNYQHSGKLVGRLSIPFSMFQTQFIDQWFPLTVGQTNCSLHLKLSFTNSNNDWKRWIWTRQSGAKDRHWPAVRNESGEEREMFGFECGSTYFYREEAAEEVLPSVHRRSEVLVPDTGQSVYGSRLYRGWRTLLSHQRA